MTYNNCPHCKVALSHTAADGRTHTNAIGHVVRGVYDGVLFWSCPDCQGVWHRFAANTELWNRALGIIGIGAVSAPETTIRA